MSNKQKRSSSMCPNMNRGRRNDYDDFNEDKSYEKNPYYSKSPVKNNYQHEITNYNGYFPNDLFDKVQKGELSANFVQTKIQHPDGRIEFQSRIDISKNHPKKIINTYDEKKVDVTTDFILEPQLKSYKTGIIFKDTHFYETLNIIPITIHKIYQRTVTQYNDGTSDYGDWRQIGELYFH